MAKKYATIELGSGETYYISEEEYPNVAKQWKRNDGTIKFVDSSNKRHTVNFHEIGSFHKL